MKRCFSLGIVLLCTLISCGKGGMSMKRNDRPTLDSSQEDEVGKALIKSSYTTIEEYKKMKELCSELGHFYRSLRMGFSSTITVKFQGCGVGRMKEKSLEASVVKGAPYWEWQAEEDDDHLFAFKDILSDDHGPLRLLCERMKKPYRLEDRILYEGMSAYKYFYRGRNNSVRELVIVTAGSFSQKAVWTVTQKEVFYFSSRNGLQLGEEEVPQIPPRGHWWVYQRESLCSQKMDQEINRSLLEQKITDWDTHP